MELRDGGCFPKPLLAVNAALAFIDGAVAVLAFCQLMRIHSRSSDLGWTRQKVFHLLIGSSNIGYFVYFVFNIIAICKRWQCWSLTFGFISMACPKILFLAAFLLLLSFWIDLCHQPYEEDEEECSPREALLVKTFNKPKLLKIDRHKTCLPIRCSHVGSRQKIVILVILSVFILMMVSAVLIWLKTGKHPNESAMVAKVYIDFFAVGVLLSGGALACYGLLLFLKMRRVRSDRALSEMWKVASLAVTSLICFTSSSFLALFTNIPLLYHWQQQQVDGAFTSVLLILYFFVVYAAVYYIISKQFWKHFSGVIVALSFSLEPSSVWHQVIQRKYDLQGNGWYVKTYCPAAHGSLRKYLNSFFPLDNFQAGFGVGVVLGGYIAVIGSPSSCFLLPILWCDSFYGIFFGTFFILA